MKIHALDVAANVLTERKKCLHPLVHVCAHRLCSTIALEAIGTMPLFE